MKVFEISSVYPAYVRSFYQRHPTAATLTYAEHKALIDADGNGGAAPYTQMMANYGIEMVSFYINMSPLQQTWSIEKGFKGLSDDEIAIEQIKAFKPDILWYTHYDQKLLQEIRKQVPSIRKVIGWVGSAIPQTKVWGETDLILSCAPETADYFKQEGLNGVHIHHAFDTRILNHLNHQSKQYDLLFIGQLIKAKGFHNHREAMLERLADQINLTVFSPITDQFTLFNRLASTIEQLTGYTLKSLGKVPMIRPLLLQHPELKRILLKEAVNWEISPSLKRVVRPAVFGIQMYQAIHQAQTVLNIHADSSPRFASNMRLWETTGVGSCLLTDWKQNIADLFVPDEEVVVYKSADECLEKVTWLLNHPTELNQIALAGQQRCIRDHSYEKRAEQLAPILHNLLN